MVLFGASTTPFGDGGHFTTRWLNTNKLIPAPNNAYFHTEKYDRGDDEFCGASRATMKKCVEATACYDKSKSHHACFSDAGCSTELQKFHKCKFNAHIADPRSGKKQRYQPLTGEDLFR